MRRIVPLVAGLAGALVLAAPAQALTCSTSSAGPLPNVIVTVGLASGETATATTSVGPGPTVLLDIAGCALEEAEAVRRLDVTGAGGAETLVYAPAAATPLPASAFTEPWRVDLGAGTGDAIELRTAGSATTLTVGADGLALDADGDRELDAPQTPRRARIALGVGVLLRDLVPFDVGRAGVVNAAAPRGPHEAVARARRVCREALAPMHAWSALARHWDDLPPDPHLRDGGED